MSASDDLLNKLHEMIGEKLLEAIESGEAPASMFAQAIKFLSDNDITSINSDALKGLENKLISKLPFSDMNDPTAHAH